MKGTSIQELRLGRNLSEQTPDAVFATKNKITNRAIVHRGWYQSSQWYRH